MAKKTSLFPLYCRVPIRRGLVLPANRGEPTLEGLRLAQVSNPIGTRVQYRLVVSVESFDRAMLEDLPIQLKVLKGITPILHLSMHGDAGGLQLTDGTEIGWKELAKLLSDINKNFANNQLIVCVSACRGFYGGMIQFFDRRRRPFKALVGPWNQPRWDDAAVAYLTFYHLLMNKGRSMKTSVEAMKMASGSQKFDSTTPDELLEYERRHSKKQG